MRWLRKRGRGQKGTTLVELAIALPVLCLLLFGMVEFGRAFNAWLIITHGAREGVRYASVGATQAEVQQKVLDTTSSLNAADLTINTLGVGGAQGTPVTVQVRYQLRIITPLISAFFPSNPITLSSDATMRLE